MNIYKHTDPAVKEFVTKFLNHVAWLKSVHYTFKELYHDDSATPIMNRTAKSFFDDLNIILHEYILLEFYKITDPAITPLKRGPVHNFTVDNLVQCVAWPEETTAEFKEFMKDVKTLRPYLQNVRNKWLAHRDKETVLNSAGYLGEFPEGEDEKFLSALEKITNIAHTACFGSIAGNINVLRPGDVNDLKETLKRALAFDRLFAESKGQELYKLQRYFEETV